MNTSFKRICGIVILASTISASAHAGGKSVRIEKIPHVRQKTDFCGEACAEMVLKHRGHSGTQDWVFNNSDISPMDARGCCTADLLKALKKIGFEPGKVWYCARVRNADREIRSIWNRIYTDLNRNIPSIVCMRSGTGRNASEHMRLICGYDADTQNVIYHEPAEDDGAYKQMKLTAFLRLWPLKYRKDYWTVIRFRMKAGKIKKYSPPSEFTDADYVQHYMKLRKQIPGGFTAVLSKPFFVIGNQSHSTVKKRWAEGTVRWTVKRLKSMYFSKEPEDILDIWLFRDKRSYLLYTKKLWNTEPGTPFGYYSAFHKVLVMNIATGGGTLVHEIVHPFMHANFPECPDWFNEGMGSLYEQSSSQNGKIIGLTNWRLSGLKKAIRRKALPPFKTMMQVSGFYGMRYGYAQARYLCYYLQKKGLLETYYRSFKAAADSDPTGMKTLKKILNIKDMDAFQKKWELWVMKLRYPPST